MNTTKSTSAAKTGRCHLPRFSLRTLMLVVMVAGPFAGWLAPPVYRYIQARNAANEEDKIETALMWLNQHQQADGSWGFVPPGNDSASEGFFFIGGGILPFLQKDEEQRSTDEL